MRNLCDVNVLLAVCHANHVHHAAALGWLDALVDEASAAICRVSQLGLLRLLNTPAVMLGNPCSVAEAWRIYHAVIADGRFIFVQEPDGLDVIFRRSMPGQLVSPKLWQDAYLAAFAIAAGDRLVTFDAAFRQFKRLDLVLLA